MLTEVLLAGDVLRRAGGGSQGGSMDKGGLGLGMSRGSLNLPSSMDIARYLEQVQEVEPMSPSPRGYARQAPWALCHMPCTFRAGCMQLGACSMEKKRVQTGARGGARGHPSQQACALLMCTA